MKNDLIVVPFLGLGDESEGGSSSGDTMSIVKLGVDLEETNEGGGWEVVTVMLALEEEEEEEGEKICARDVVFLGFGRSICGIGDM